MKKYVHDFPQIAGTKPANPGGKKLWSFFIQLVEEKEDKAFVLGIEMEILFLLKKIAMKSLPFRERHKPFQKIKISDTKLNLHKSKTNLYGYTTCNQIPHKVAFY